jgi:hypothetical protein
MSSGVASSLKIIGHGNPDNNLESHLNSRGTDYLNFSHYRTTVLRSLTGTEFIFRTIKPFRRLKGKEK